MDVETIGLFIEVETQGLVETCRRIARWWWRWWFAIHRRTSFLLLCFRQRTGVVLVVFRYSHLRLIFWDLTVVLLVCFPFPRIQSLPAQRFGLVEFPLRRQKRLRSVDRYQRARVFVSETASASIQSLSTQRFDFLQFARHNAILLILPPTAAVVCSEYMAWVAAFNRQ